MRKTRQTRLQIDEEIKVLIARKKALAEEAADLFMKNFLTKEVKEILMDATNEEIVMAAKKVITPFKEFFASKNASNTSKLAKKTEAPKPQEVKTEKKQTDGIDRSKVFQPISSMAIKPNTTAPAKSNEVRADRHD